MEAINTTRQRVWKKAARGSLPKPLLITDGTMAPDVRTVQRRPGPFSKGYEGYAPLLIPWPTQGGAFIWLTGGQHGFSNEGVCALD